MTSTPQLDSIVALGHSGTTGYGSDPDNPTVDARENSWATGTRPSVNSIYQRLLADHPALEGHATSLGVDGSTVDDLAAQVERMLELDPLPDVVIIQSIDNDIRCDGADQGNIRPFGDELDAVLTTIETEAEHAQVYFVDQWASVATYTAVTAGMPGGVEAQSGDGPCDPFAPDGSPTPQRAEYLQSVVDAYFKRIVEVCAQHADCYTDGGALQDFPLRPEHLTADRNHLSVAGQAVMAGLAWEAMPDAIKTRP